MTNTRTKTEAEYFEFHRLPYQAENAHQMLSALRTRGDLAVVVATTETGVFYGYYLPVYAPTIRDEIAKLRKFKPLFVEVFKD